MKLLLTHIYCWPEVRRGGERYLHELGAALIEAGHQVQIVSSSLTPSTDEQLGVPVQRLARRGRTAEIAFGRDVLRRHLFDSIDVWHAFGTGDAYAAAQLSRWRKWPRVRSVYTDLGGPLRSYRATRPDHPQFEYAVKHLDAYLCLSEATRALLESDYHRTGLVVGGGVDLNRFTPGVRTEHPTLLFTSALDEPRKNLPLLLAAMDQVLAARPNARLTLCGSGDPSAALADASVTVRAATDVVGVGEVDDLPRRYGESWVTVLPSMREAFGLVLVESLACGTPIVAVAGSGGPAEIVHDGVGALAATDTPAALAEASLRALAFAESGDGATAACRGEAVQRYSWRDAIVPRLEQIYRGELSG